MRRTVPRGTAVMVDSRIMPCRILYIHASCAARINAYEWRIGVSTSLENGLRVVVSAVQKAGTKRRFDAPYGLVRKPCGSRGDGESFLLKPRKPNNDND